MRFDRREIVGPILIGATATLIVASEHLAQDLPNPGAIVLCVVALAAFFFGFRSGSALLAIGFFAFHFLRSEEWLRYEPHDLTRLLVVAVAATIEDRVAKLEHELAALRRKLDAVMQMVPGATTD